MATTLRVEQELSDLGQSPLVEPLIVQPHGTAIRGQKWKTCMRRWALPLAVVSVSLSMLAVGATCWMPGEQFFPSCSAFFVPIGLLLPAIAMLTAIFCSKPNHRQSTAHDFYSNALLEDFLAAEDQTPLYSIRNKGGAYTKGVVVLLAGIGGVCGDWAAVEQRCVSLGFCVLTVQLPGSGKLRAVGFSFKRAARVISHTLDTEFLSAVQFSNVESLGHRQERRYSAMSRLPNAIHNQQRTNSLPHGVQVTQQPSATPHQLRIVLVGYGLSTRVVCHICSNRRLGASIVHGVILAGTRECLVPKRLGWWTNLRLNSFRLSWVADICRRIEYYRYNRALEHLSGGSPGSGLQQQQNLCSKRPITPTFYNPVARADWVHEANSHVAEHLAIMHGFRGRVSVCTDSQSTCSDLMRRWGEGVCEDDIVVTESSVVKNYPFRSSVPKQRIPEFIVEQVERHFEDATIRVGD